MQCKLDFTKIDWLNVLPQFGIHKDFLTKKEGPCPICNGKTRFRFKNTNKLGEWFCTKCEGGNALTLLRLFTGRSDKSILSDINRFSGIKAERSENLCHVVYEDEISPEQAAKNRVVLAKTQRMALNLAENDPVVRYLSKRVPGSDFRYLRSIKFVPRMIFWEEGDKENGDKQDYINRGNFPVMLAKVVDGKSNPITLHRTYLTFDGNKAPFEKVKKQMMGVRKLKGAAIRLCINKNSRVLGVCEGNETGWAIATAYNYKINVWPMLNCFNLSIADIPRDQFDKVIIFADHDKYDETKGYRPGEHFARILQKKLLAEGFEVELKIPPKEGQDFADLWLEYYNSFHRK